MKRKFKNVEVANDENKKKRVSTTEALNAQSKTNVIKKKRPKKSKNIDFIDTDQLTNSFSNVESSEKETEVKNNSDEEETEQLECRSSDSSIRKKQKKPKHKATEDLNFSEHGISKKQKKIKQSEDNSSTENDQNHKTDENTKKRKKKEQKINIDSSHQPSEFTELGEEIVSKKQKMEDDLYKPTDMELNECQNPENIKQTKVSIRQQKREKNRKRLIEQKEKNEAAAKLNVLNYLSLWKHSRDHWKFEKLKQIWLFNNMFDENKVPDNMWEILIEYINGSKGKARRSLLESAMKIIEKAEEQTETDQIEEDSKYKRARNILQCLQE